SPSLRAKDDVRAWGAAVEVDAPPCLPPLVWVGAPEVIEGRINATATSIRLDSGTSLALELAPKHPLNRSYFDASSAEFLARRPLKVRGTTGSTFVARTIWPRDFRFEANPPEIALPHDVPFA